MKIKLNFLLLAFFIPVFIWVTGYNRTVTSTVTAAIKNSGNICLECGATSGISMDDAGFLRIRGRLADKIPGFNRLLTVTRFAPGLLNTGYFFNNHFIVFYMNRVDCMPGFSPAKYIFNRVFLI